MEAITAAGSVEAEIVKEAGAELTPELDTVIDADPAEAISEYGMAAVSCVELTNAVPRAEPFQSTTEPFTKFVPFTVRVNPKGLHDGVVFDEVMEDDKDVMAGGTIVNGICPEVPPPGPSVNTSTWAAPIERKSAAGTVAMSWVALTYVVVSDDVTLPTLTHCTTEQGRKGRTFVSVTVKVSAGPPAAAEVCDSELIEGAESAVAGVERVNGKVPDVPIELVTVTVAVPGNAAWTAEIGAVNCVALTKVVVCATPFQFTTASLVKFAPFTVSVKPWELQ
jgi:hypothetical protein